VAATTRLLASVLAVAAAVVVVVVAGNAVPVPNLRAACVLSPRVSAARAPRSADEETPSLHTQTVRLSLL